MAEVENWVPAESRLNSMNPGTRIMIFQDEVTNAFLAFGVDIHECVQGKTIDELRQHWQVTAEAYKSIRDDIGEWWEPPKPFEFEAVWLNGEPCEFLDGLEARTVSRDEFRAAHNVYHERYKSYGLGLTSCGLGLTEE